MPQLICKNLTLGYENQVIFEGLHFTVNAGDYLCVLGENGSGKSTLMKTILGLVKPLSGTIETGDGVSSREIGYLSQQTQIQRDFPASVQEIVLSGFSGRIGLRPFYNKEERRIAQKNMERMNVLDLRKRCYRELSGGQQQRVLLSRALCATEKMLLLDEPVSGLDANASADMYELIHSLNRNEKLTVIMITHDLYAASKYASHVLHISDSNHFFFGTRDEYVQSSYYHCFHTIKEEADKHE